jgi:FkbM family methyltransferase
LGIETITVETFGGERPMRMDFDQTLTNEVLILHSLVKNGSYEPELSALMLRVLRDGDVVVDVGANVGYFSLLAATAVGPTGRVLAIEADPANTARIANNRTLNDFGQIEIIEAAASSAVGEITFHLNSDNNGGNALWDPGLHPENPASRAAPKSLTVPATTVNAEAKKREITRAKLIKIDTEGAEHLILKGAGSLLKMARTPFIVAELHEFGLKQMGSNQMELRKYMESHGYSTFVLYYDDSMPRLVPPGSEIRSQYLLNVLFSTPEHVGRYWPVLLHDPRLAGRAK